jgi:hypothetical protein
MWFDRIGGRIGVSTTWVADTVFRTCIRAITFFEQHALFNQRDRLAAL